MRVYFTLVYRRRPFAGRYRPRQYWVEATSLDEAAQKIATNYWRDPWVWNRDPYEIDTYLSAWDGSRVLFDRYHFSPSMPRGGHAPGDVADTYGDHPNIPGQRVPAHSNHRLVDGYWEPNYQEPPKW